MLSRRLLLGLPSRLPENRCILVQSTSKAGGQVRPAGADFLLVKSTVYPRLLPWASEWVRCAKAEIFEWGIVHSGTCPFQKFPLTKQMARYGAQGVMR